MSFLTKQLNGMTTNCLGLIQGKAGTGKSFLIHKMINLIDSFYQKKATLLLAPTGVAANNINGCTIHSALRLPPTKGNLPPLTGQNLLEFQEELKNIEYVIIDESSMLGLNLLFKIDQRLRSAKPNHSDSCFGGLKIFLVGDWSQLPPVCDQSLYCKSSGLNHQALQASVLYQQFDTVFFLTQILRQQGNEQKHFREILERISTGQINQQDYNILSTRFHSNNIGDDSFQDAVCIMSKNLNIDAYNYEKLESLNAPVALIKAVHNCNEARLASLDEAQGLPAELRLAKGAKVILRRNLWVSKGLANGSVGTVTDIIYEPSNFDNHNEYYEQMPICIMVKFQKYSGPSVYNGSIPVVPITSNFKKKDLSCSRKQFPLTLGFAVSVHRSQGITLDKAIIDIGDNEFQIGLTYVALSRVKTLDGLLLKPAFNFDRLAKINKSTSMIARLQELNRLKSLSK